ncbi:MAG: lytic transglycosylase domain-containing protein [Ilumatobacteraceae bacterium]
MVGVAAALMAGCSSDSDTTATTPKPVETIVAPPNAAAATTVPIATTTLLPSATRIVADLNAEGIAALLTRIEQAAATGDGSGGARQQLLYRYMSAHPDLDAAVLAAVSDDVRPYVERIVSARQFAQARQATNPSSTPPSDVLPAWTVIDPLPADELLRYYNDAEAATGIAWYWLAAIHLQETRMGRIIGRSSAGAVGPMQFLPTTWEQCCTGDPLQPRDAIIGAATYLSKSGGPSDMPGALHDYNPSDSYVATVTAFAENMRDNPNLYSAYREWQVFYASSAGTVRLPVGYTQAQPIDAATYIADHPQDAG